MEGEQWVQVDERQVRLRNLNKVLYPSSGTTKAEVIAYYAAVAPLMLPYLVGRPVTRRRWPHGVELTPGSPGGFFEKQVSAGTPRWVPRVRLHVPGSTMERESIDFPLVEDMPTLVWMANAAALELHVPQWQVEPKAQAGQGELAEVDVQAQVPDRLVIDLDPGAGVGLAQCVQVAFAVRQYFAADGITDCQPVTSGRHGLQIYAPRPVSCSDAESVVRYAKRLADTLMQALPSLVTAAFARSRRVGKVMIDWGQNVTYKTTICPYSLRGTPVAHAAFPRSWDELTEPNLQQLTLDQALARVAKGDTT